jgi:2'-5' RNA ligase
MGEAPPAPEVVSDRKGTESKRLFVGVRVSVGTANALSSACETLARRARDARQDWRFVAPTSFHVTLKYLGWTRIEAIGPLRDALATAVRGVDRISYRAARVGGFASLERATVVWAGIDEQGAVALGALAARVEATCAGLGFASETRAFHPHITLARLRDLASAKEVVLPIAEQMFGESKVHEVILYETDAKSTGSAYREIAQIPFAGTERAPATAPERQSPPVELGASDDTDDGWPRGH